MASSYEIAPEEVAEFLSDILERHGLTDANIEISSDVQKCDGYLSRKITISSANKDLNLILKYRSESNECGHNGLCREIFYYDRIYKCMKELQEEYNVVRPNEAIATVYKTQSNEGAEKLVMQDPRQLGFQTGPRRFMFDEEHVILVLKEYGKMHANSFAMQELNTTFYDELTKHLGCKYPEFNDAFYDKCLVAINRIIELFNEEGDRVIKEAIVKLRNGMDGFFTRLFTETPKYHAIVHGSCSCTNILFKYEKSSVKPSKLCLLDFQMAFNTSPVLDLSYFLYCNVSKEIYSDLDRYLKIYHDTLSQHLQQMECDPKILYPFYALQNDWKKYAKFGFIMSALLEDSVLVDNANENDERSLLFDRRNINQKVSIQRLHRSLRSLSIHMFENDFL